MWPSLSYNLITVPGAENTLPRPIYLLPLNMAEGKEVGPDQGAELTLKAIPGFKLTILPRSATFPDGSKRGFITVTVVNSTKIPMTPPNGMQPSFIVTLSKIAQSDHAINLGF